jgi:hypothetical protein
MRFFGYRIPLDSSLHKRTGVPSSDRLQSPGHMAHVLLNAIAGANDGADHRDKGVLSHATRYGRTPFLFSGRDPQGNMTR